MAKRPKIDRSYEEIERLINSWILSERNRNLMKRRLLDGIIYDKLAEEFTLSVEQVKNIVYQSEEIIFRHL